jgi:small subunit ribosomal protein S18
MARQQRTGTSRRKSDRDDRKPKKKVSILDQESISYVDYKDVNLLRRFMSERAKIRARRVTGNDAKQQREVARAIRVAREMALLPYSVRQVTHRNKGKRDRDRDDRPLRAQDTSAPRPPEGSAPPPDGSSAPPADLDIDTSTDLDAAATDIVDVELEVEVEVDAGTEVEVDAGTEVEESSS